MYIKKNPFPVNNFEYEDNPKDVESNSNNIEINEQNNNRSTSVQKTVFTGAVQSAAKTAFDNFKVSYPDWLDPLIALSITTGGLGLCILIGAVAICIYILSIKYKNTNAFRIFMRGRNGIDNITDSNISCSSDSIDPSKPNPTATNKPNPTAASTPNPTAASTSAAQKSSTKATRIECEFCLKLVWPSQMKSHLDNKHVVKKESFYSFC